MEVAFLCGCRSSIFVCVGAEAAFLCAWVQKQHFCVRGCRNSIFVCVGAEGHAPWALRFAIDNERCPAPWRPPQNF